MDAALASGSGRAVVHFCRWVCTGLRNWGPRSPPYRALPLPSRPALPRPYGRPNPSWHACMCAPKGPPYRALPLKFMPVFASGFQ